VRGREPCSYDSAFGVLRCTLDKDLKLVLELSIYTKEKFGERENIAGDSPKNGLRKQRLAGD
jgi:hypothetical protein